MFTRIDIEQLNVSNVLSFLEFLVQNGVSIHMLKNYVSALKAVCVIYQLHFNCFDHPRVRLFVKSIQINKPLVVKPKNVMDVSVLETIIAKCAALSNPVVYRALFSVAFFGFFRLSNCVPHAMAQFDHTHHFTGADVFFSKHSVKLLLKWSKTIQQRDQCKLITLPRLKGRSFCPFSLLKSIFTLYSPGSLDPLFQCRTIAGWVPLTDSQVRKALATINQAMHLPKNYFTFHAFRRSGATLAYESQVPVSAIKEHGTWTSECVWRYIQSERGSTTVADVFHRLLV